MSPIGLVLAKALVTASAVALFFSQLATPPGVVAAVIGTIAGYLGARYAQKHQLRVIAGVVVGLVVALLGRFLGGFLLDHPIGSIPTALRTADAIGCGLGMLGGFFAVRIVAQAWRPASLIELAVVVGTVAHTFSAHRRHHVNEPQFLTDWAFSHGIDPTQILEACGVTAVALAAILLLEPRRLSKLLVSLLFLIVTSIVAFFLLRDRRIDLPTDTNAIGLTGSDKAKGSANADKGSGSGSDGSGKGSGGGSGSGGGGQGSGSGSAGGGSGSGSGGGASNKPPDPVAVVVLHDEIPDADVLYFRQSVLSRFAVDRLVEETSDRFDHDLFRKFPAIDPMHIASPQTPDLHRKLHTSVYLMVDHAQPFGLGMPYEIRPLENPNPQHFVAAYDVESFMLDVTLDRLAGRTASGAELTPEERKHYTELPADPRYVELANQITRDTDPRFVGDDVMKAVALKRYLETTGFYSLAEKELVGTDPTAKFLFGEKRGYCVHFAHALSFLLRSQGIPARVALGYAVPATSRGSGSSIILYGNEAHAWPEMYVDGVGWVTMDVYPEKSDEPPPAPANGQLESMLGELAHKDKTGGKAADPNDHLEIPWGALIAVGFGLVGLFLVGAYGIKLVRRAQTGSHAQVYRGVLDALTGLGLGRRAGESRERHAARIGEIAPSFAPLTTAHLRAALGGREELPAMIASARATRSELGKLPFIKRFGATLHPLSWWFTR